MYMVNRKAKVKNIICLAGVIVVLFGLLGLIKLSTPKVFEGFEATPSNFNSKILSGKKFVWFYATWCGHCKSVHKSWDAAADEVNVGDKHMIKIDIGDGKNPEHQEISKKYNIKGFPTMLLLDNRKKVDEYRGNRSKTEFINYCKQNNLMI